MPELKRSVLAASVGENKSFEQTTSERLLFNSGIGLI
jgi:hypothetical protein